MPELPEVETIARSLRNAAGLDFATWQGLNARPGIVGRTIYSATVNWSRSIATPEIEVFRQQISGQVVQGVNRRGKFLVLQLDRDWLLIHLRMSGDVRVEPADSGLVQPHDRVILDFQDGTRLVFNDPRKFGRLWLVSHPDEVLSGLGPEPLAVELTPATFYAMLHARKTPVKPLLMDQRFICGLGNIYTDEALHQAQIHPLQKAHTLSHEESERLLSTIRDVLREGIQRNGASIDWVYRGGDFQNFFRVYQRTGKPCLRCGTAIERIVVGQRGTHFCPLCQVIH